MRGRNAKGTAPLKLLLHTACALIAADGPLRATGGFSLALIDGEHWFVELHVIDRAEFDRTVAHLWPDVEVLDADVGPFRPIDMLPARVRQPAPRAVLEGRDWIRSP